METSTGKFFNYLSNNQDHQLLIFFLLPLISPITFALLDLYNFSHTVQQPTCKLLAITRREKRKNNRTGNGCDISVNVIYS